MACQILISNKSGIASGEIVTVQSMGHKFSPVETMQEFLLSGGLYDSWSRLFSKGIITDKDEVELSYLLETITTTGKDGEAQTQNKYYFVQPEVNTELFSILIATGEVSAPFAVFNQYLRSR
tara:strand:- start:757 stop:1122 length:366 start_codon:yes stop_codon:yes gene_type:complete